MTRRVSIGMLSVALSVVRLGTYSNHFDSESPFDESQAEQALAPSFGYQQAFALRAQIGSGGADEVGTVRQAVEADPSAESYIELGLAYYLVGEYSESLAVALDATRIDDAYATAHNNVCAAHNALEEFDLAVIACRRALLLDPLFVLAQGNLDWALPQLDADG